MGDTPYPARSFVLTHEKRDPLKTKSAAFTFVNEGVESAVRRAKAAAGDKDIIVMGADIARQMIKARLVDEIVLQLAPVLLGQGTRLFDGMGNQKIELKIAKTLTSPLVTHLRYEVL